MSEAVTTPGAVAAPVAPDPTHFVNRYPTLPELLQFGGKAGVEYCLVSGARLRLFQNEGWSPIRDLPTLSISGPKGTVDTVVLMGKGDPIRGAADFNGIRRYYVDVVLEETVGIPANSQSPVATQSAISAANLATKEKQVASSQKGQVQEGD